MGTQSESNFRNFFNHIDDFVFVLDMNGNIIETNEAVTSILGYPKSELVGKNIITVHPPEYRAKAMEIVGKMVAGTCKSCPLPLLSKGRAYIPVETKVFEGIWNSEKALIGVSRNLSDIAFSEDKFYKVFDKGQLSMAISEVETGTFVNVNRQFVSTLGYTKEEIIGKRSKDINLFGDYSQREQLVKRVLKGESVENEEMVVLTKAGQQLSCLVSAAKIQLQAQGYLLTSAIDISHLKQVELKLKRNLQQQTLLADISKKLNSVADLSGQFNEALRLLGEHLAVSRVYIFEDNADGTATSNTYEWCNVGVSPQQEELQNIPYELIPSWKPMLVGQGKVFSTNIKELPEDIVAVLEPQGIRSILVFPLYVQGEFFGFIGFDECALNRSWEADDVELLRTISNIISNTFDRIRYQEQLRESETQFKMAIENTEAGLWDWNIPTGRVYYNDIWCRMIGYDRSEIEPDVKSWERLVNPEDMPCIEKALDRHLSGEQEYYETVHRLLTKSGRWKWVMDKGRVIERDEAGNPIRAIGTHIDIDQQKRTEHELRIANATKDKFFSIIGHDLRGPIGSLMQISELISEKGNVDEATLYDFLNSQKELSKSTFQLLENLLSWAKYNLQQIEYKPKRVNLSGIIDEVAATVRFQAVGKRISIVADYSGAVGAYADEDMVKLIVRNILSNALKFTPHGGSVRIELLDEGDFLAVSITDTGVGISDENIDKILSDDKYLTTYGTENEKGTGLGLKLCKSFIALNGGVLKIASELDRGTTFSFTLPKESPVA
jgi:PAS domain S-box-containing protein